ncbi:MAG: response regulator transcription factor [Candidatus Hydrogenedens sp.]|nr:response regulator [Candidatus Hydrogenedentota bacterium]NLF56874.1 response regulator transcription factor [Candidatus Hydrogenedens sp.]
MSRILIIDDEVDLTELVKTKLSAEGHQIYVINTGEGAFEYAKKVKPDICLLDIMLPGATGYQICRRMRKDPELYRMAILMLTALGEEPEVVHGLEQGADDYLVKPFKLERLMDKVASLNALLTTLNIRNRLSNLPGTDAIKREINHQLARGTAIACVYVDIVGFEAYCKSRGQEGQRLPIEAFAKMLAAATRSLNIYECFPAHMGRQHFVIMLKLEDWERFCAHMARTFDEESRRFYTQEELNRGCITVSDNQGREVRCPLMALSIGVAHTQQRQFKSAKKMFEVLAQVRQKAQPADGKSIVFADRRHSDR